MILVVGATGQVGSLVVRRLRADGAAVRAMVRDPASAADLAATGAELAVADLRRPETLDAALDGVTAVVATANAVGPRPPRRQRRGGRDRLRRAGPAAERAGVSRFVLASVPETRSTSGSRSPVRSGAPSSSSPRPACLAVATDAAVLRGLAGPRRQRAAAAGRGAGHAGAGPTRPCARFRRVTGARSSGTGSCWCRARPRPGSAFLSVHDAAAGLAAAVRPETGTGPVDLGGPEALSWTDVARIYERVLDRRVRVVSQPAAVYAVLSRVLGPSRRPWPVSWD